MDTVTTRTGRIRGRRIGSLCVFRGIPYARAPVGDLRFRSPQSPVAWTGVRDAERYGPAPIQTIAGPARWCYTEPELMDEDCLYLNVWSPQNARNKPVIVWIHGGGFRTGAASLPLFDGTQIAARGEVVFVSINYRNSALGWMAHADLRDPETGLCANWGLQDQLLALRWVRENIADFGGNPDNITVMGQSGGAINAVMLGQAAAILPFDKLILLSPPYIAPPAMPDLADASLFAEDLAHQFSVSPTGLRQVPAQELHDRELTQWRSNLPKARTGRFLRGPVADGLALMDWPPLLELPDVPILLSYTRTEGSFWTELSPGLAPQQGGSPQQDVNTTREAALNFLKLIYDFGSNNPAPAEVIDTYVQACAQYGVHDPLACFTELYGDALLRHYGIRALERAAGRRHGSFLLDFAAPIITGRGTPHCADLPFVFGTFAHPYYASKVGAGPRQRRISDALIDAFSNFAKTGEPDCEALKGWPRFDRSSRLAMSVGSGPVVGEVSPIVKYEQMRLLDSLQMYGT